MTAREGVLAFINRLRKEKGYKLQQLCEGLCSHGTIVAMALVSKSIYGRWWNARSLVSVLQRGLPFF